MAKYTLLNISPGPPTKFTYYDNEAGEEVVKNQEIVDEPVINSVIEEGEDDAVAPGSTTFFQPDGKGGVITSKVDKLAF